jgi:hypothetical protein
MTKNRIPKEFRKTGSGSGKIIAKLFREAKKAGYEIVRNGTLSKKVLHDGVEIYSALRWRGNYWIISWDTRYFQTEEKEAK